MLFIFDRLDNLTYFFLFFSYLLYFPIKALALFAPDWEKNETKLDYYSKLFFVFITSYYYFFFDRLFKFNFK